MSILKQLLLVIALALFLLASWPPASARVNLVALGLAAWVATWLLPG